MDVPLPPAQPYFRFSDKTESLKLVSQAGFEKPSFEIVPLVWRLASPEELFLAFFQGAVRATVILRNQPEDAIAKIRPEILNACECFAIDKGIEVPMGAALTVASKP
jgi:hypothetical protein